MIVSYLIGVFVFATIVGKSGLVLGGCLFERVGGCLDALLRGCGCLVERVDGCLGALLRGCGCLVERVGECLDALLRRYGCLVEMVVFIWLRGCVCLV